MVRKTDPEPRLKAALLEMVSDGLVSPKTGAKITARILGQDAKGKPKPLSPREIAAIREASNMSQAVFARVLNVTSGYVSQLERGVKCPTGPALALLHVIKRKGVGVML